MSQDTAFGKCELTEYHKVLRAKTGKTEFYKTVDGQTAEITQQEYDEAHAPRAAN